MEQETSKEICKLSYTPIDNLIGKLNLKQLFALIKRSQSIISPDSSPAHIATTVATPVIGLLSTSNPDFTGPYNNAKRDVNRYLNATQKLLGQRIENLPRGKRFRDLDAMDMTTIDDIVKT